jgi:DNA uptake protein ComE-like DNA-binding protein
MLLILTGLAIILSFTMRVEVEISGNNLSQAQADAVELGAEQFVMYNVDPANPDWQGEPTYITNPANVNCEARPVGGGYFWIMTPSLAPYADTQDQPLFGITDECGKLNLNTATATMLGNLPGMINGANSSIPASIVAWRGNGKPVASGGSPTAASTSQDQQYYATFQSPYVVKNAAFESVDELMMVKGIVPDPGTQLGTVLNSVDPLYGNDTNHNGVLDDSEQNGTGGNQLSADQPGALGFAPCVTVYSMEPNVDYFGNAQVNVNTASTSQLTTALQGALAGSRLSAVLSAIQRGKPFSSILDFYTRSTMTVTEFTAVSPLVTTKASTTTTTTGGTTTTSSGTPGLINICTAPEAVLACLPGLTDTDAQTLIAARESAADPTTVAWAATALTPAQTALIAPVITARSFQYSADIIAVSGDGRSFKRVRIVVDTQSGVPTILYRKDLTNLGWPLDPSIREKLQTSTSKPSTKGGT